MHTLGAVVRTVLMLLLSSAASFAATFDAEYEYDGPNPPRFMVPIAQIAPITPIAPIAAITPTASEARPRVALVLGSGGRRGFAHAGVLRVLESANIKPDLIVGVSVGSIIGALYASGMSAAQVEQLALTLELSALIDLSWLHWGRIRGQKLQDFVNTQVNQRPMESFAIRFAVVATRRQDGVMHIFNQGNTGVAVRASSAVPDRFYALRIGGVTYVDGDVASPVPVRAARLLGAEVVIAVDISANHDNVPQSVPDGWLRVDRARRMRIDAESRLAEVLIHPDIGYYAGTSGNYRARAIAAAAEATRAALPSIKAAISSQRANVAGPAPVPAK